MSKIYKLNKFVFLTCLFLFSCKSQEVVPGSERVRVFDSEPKGCLYVGEISSVQDDRTVGTLETEMDLTTRIDLRNKAHALGGNILVFLKGKNTNTLPGTELPAVAAKTAVAKPVAGETSAPAATAVPKKEPVNKDTLVFLATVFKCPSSILHQ